MNYPYNDENMIYDYKTHRYVLTEEGILNNLGINLAERTQNETAKTAFIRLATTLVYRFIHSCNVNNDYQDYIIAKTASGRAIIKEALEQQIIYMCMVGDLSRSADKTEREMYLDSTAEETLMQVIPEIGRSVCYAGNFGYCVSFNGEW